MLYPFSIFNLLRFIGPCPWCVGLFFLQIHYTYFLLCKDVFLQKHYSFFCGCQNYFNCYFLHHWSSFILGIQNWFSSDQVSLLSGVYNCFSLDALFYIPWGLKRFSSKSYITYPWRGKFFKWIMPFPCMKIKWKYWSQKVFNNVGQIVNSKWI